SPRQCSPSFRARKRRRPSKPPTKPRTRHRRTLMFSHGDLLIIPFDDWINDFVRGWLVPNFRPAFRAAQVPITMVLNALDDFFNFLPMLLTTAVFALAAWKWTGRGMAIFTLI